MQIEGAVAIVTGGASGLGEATARGLHAAGARVAIFDMNEERGRRIVEELGDRAAFAKVNVTHETEVEAGIDIAGQLGQIRICVNCAGIGVGQKTVSKKGPHDLALFRRVIEVNLIGTFCVARLAAERMIEGKPDENGERGVIINTASIAAFEGQMGQIAYSASKGGVVGMTMPMARDLARDGIRAMTIAPGLIDTPLFESLPDEVIAGLVQDIEHPKRLGKAAEYALLTRQIVENPYLNGETIRLDAAARMRAR